MRAQLIIFAAAALLTGGPASAASRTDLETQHYAERANARAAALVAARGIETHDAAVSVRARVRSDGSVAGMQVLRTSGAPETDRAVARVLRQILVSDAPAGLMNGAVTLTVGHGGPAFQTAGQALSH